MNNKIGERPMIYEMPVDASGRGITLFYFTFSIKNTRHLKKSVEVVNTFLAYLCLYNVNIFKTSLKCNLLFTIVFLQVVSDIKAYFVSECIFKTLFVFFCLCFLCYWNWLRFTLCGSSENMIFKYLALNGYLI